MTLRLTLADSLPKTELLVVGVIRGDDGPQVAAPALTDEQVAAVSRAATAVGATGKPDETLRVPGEPYGLPPLLLDRPRAGHGDVPTRSPCAAPQASRCAWPPSRRSPSACRPATTPASSRRSRSAPSSAPTATRAAPRRTRRSPRRDGSPCWWAARSELRPGGRPSSRPRRGRCTWRAVWSTPRPATCRPRPSPPRRWPPSRAWTSRSRSSTRRPFATGASAASSASARARRTRRASSACSTAPEEDRRAPGAWSARASPSTPAASRSSRLPAWSR